MAGSAEAILELVRDFGNGVVLIRIFKIVRAISARLRLLESCVASCRSRNVRAAQIHETDCCGKSYGRDVMFNHNFVLKR